MPGMASNLQNTTPGISKDGLRDFQGPTATANQGWPLQHAYIIGNNKQRRADMQNTR